MSKNIQKWTTARKVRIFEQRTEKTYISASKKIQFSDNEKFLIKLKIQDFKKIRKIDKNC